jgi:hypothetical protein
LLRGRLVCESSVFRIRRLQGNYAYVADGTSGLRIVDVANPATPSEVGSYDTPGQAWAVMAAASYAYVADREAGLRIIDVANPATPSEVGFYDTPGDLRDATVAGSYTYLADGLGGWSSCASLASLRRRRQPHRRQHRHPPTLQRQQPRPRR